MTRLPEPARGVTAPSPAADRRASPRYACNLDTFCQPGTGKVDDFWWRARVRDISLHGISLIVGKRFEPGIGLLVELPGPRRNLAALQVQVMHSTPYAEGRWVTGCRFAWALSDEEMRVCL
jgi:hypothetical protein